MGIFAPRKTKEEREEERRIQHSQHMANITHEHALHLLDLIETRHDVYGGLRSGFDGTGCIKKGHWNTTRLDPDDHPKAVTCVVRVDTVSKEDREQLIGSFKKRGFKVDKPGKYPCGCMTLTVHPRRFPQD